MIVEKYEKPSMEVVELLSDPISTTVITSCAGGILGFSPNNLAIVVAEEDETICSTRSIRVLHIPF